MITDGDLRGIDLHGINFSGSILIHRNLETSNLNCADLSFARLETSFLANAKLRYTKLNKAALADLEDYDNEPPDLTGSNWWDARWMTGIESGVTTWSDRAPEWLESKFPRLDAASINEAMKQQCSGQ